MRKIRKLNEKLERILNSTCFGLKFNPRWGIVANAPDVNSCKRHAPLARFPEFKQFFNHYVLEE